MNKIFGIMVLAVCCFAFDGVNVSNASDDIAGPKELSDLKLVSVDFAFEAPGLQQRKPKFVIKCTITNNTNNELNVFSENGDGCMSIFALDDQGKKTMMFPFDNGVPGQPSLYSGSGMGVVVPKKSATSYEHTFEASQVAPFLRELNNQIVLSITVTSIDGKQTAKRIYSEPVWIPEAVKAVISGFKR